jgi:mRNA-degrading endonuclease RelE of RelBE toxin-antitoxin system
MYKFIFTKNWEKSFTNISLENRNRIITKLKSLKNVDNIFHYIKIIYNLEPATHRMRIWNFRLLISIEWNTIFIYKVWNRGDIYK